MSYSSIYAFYLSLLGEVPTLLLESHEAMLAWVLLFAFFAGLVNPELAKFASRVVGRISGGEPWTGSSRAWAFVPLVILLVWGLLRANYERYESAAQTLRDVSSDRDTLRTQLAAERDRSRPHLELWTNTLVVGQNSRTRSASAIIIAAVSNVGAPSIAEGWELEAMLGKRGSLRGVPTYITPGEPVTLRS